MPGASGSNDTDSSTAPHAWQSRHISSTHPSLMRNSPPVTSSTLSGFCGSRAVCSSGVKSTGASAPLSSSSIASRSRHIPGGGVGILLNASPSVSRRSVTVFTVTGITFAPSAFGTSFARGAADLRARRLEGDFFLSSDISIL